MTTTAWEGFKSQRANKYANKERLRKDILTVLHELAKAFCFEAGATTVWCLACFLLALTCQ